MEDSTSSRIPIVLMDENGKPRPTSVINGHSEATAYDMPITPVHPLLADRRFRPGTHWLRYNSSGSGRIETATRPKNLDVSKEGVPYCFVWPNPKGGGFIFFMTDAEFPGRPKLGLLSDDDEDITMDDLFPPPPPIEPPTPPSTPPPARDLCTRPPSVPMLPQNCVPDTQPDELEMPPGPLSSRIHPHRSPTRSMSHSRQLLHCRPRRSASPPHRQSRTTSWQCRGELLHHPSRDCGLSGCHLSSASGRLPDSGDRENAPCKPVRESHGIRVLSTNLL